MRKTTGPSEALLNLAIVDDHPLMRTGFAALVEQWPHGRVVLQAEDGVDYERQCAEVGHIHIAVVDLCMPRRDGYETIRCIRRDSPRTLPLAIAVDPTPHAISRAVRLGARGIVAKNVDATALFKALDHLRLAGFHYNDLLSRQLHRALEQEEEQRSPDALWAALTDREREFVLLYTDPAVPTMLAVAEHMGLECRTVETHRSKVATKLGVRTKAELVRMVLEHGWT